MARYAEPTPEQEKEWAEWVAELPPVVRTVAERFFPWELYRMKSTGQRVTVAAFNEDGTLRVDVRGDFNFVWNERSVFGIDPDDLEPCDIPPEDELTGSILTGDQVEENIDALRMLVRPDLWEIGPDGKAHRIQKVS